MPFNLPNSLQGHNILSHYRLQDCISRIPSHFKQSIFNWSRQLVYTFPNGDSDASLPLYASMVNDVGRCRVFE
jgi:hypothetical protein